MRKRSYPTATELLAVSEALSFVEHAIAGCASRPHEIANVREDVRRINGHRRR